MKYKFTGILSAAAFVLTLVWLSQMIGAAARYGSFEGFEDALTFAREHHWFFYTATYANVLLLTFCNAMLYGSLYGLLKDEQPEWAGAGLVFIPLYTILATTAYLSQLVVTPALIGQLDDPQTRLMNLTLLRHWLQIWPYSTIQAFDQFSYFFLGFSGLIFGLLMTRKAGLKIPGWLFMVSGVFCLPIGPGIILGIPALVGIPSMIGGVLSIAATGWLAVSLLKKSSGG